MYNQRTYHDSVYYVCVSQSKTVTIKMFKYKWKSLKFSKWAGTDANHEKMFCLMYADFEIARVDRDSKLVIKIVNESEY